MQIELTGKRVAITAGAGGIGRVTADRFVAAGATVWVCDVDEAAIADFRSKHPASAAFVADVSVSDQVNGFFDRMERELGGVDVLINNAGISGPTKPVEAISDDEWNRTLGVNITGQFFCARRVVPMFKKQRGGVIVNMSSVAGRLGMPLRAPYSATKYAVRGLTDVLAVELGEYDIRVNAIMPGLVNGPRGQRVMREQAQARNMTYEQYLPFVLHNISMHSMVEMEEIADLAIFLASDFARHITGQSIGVCGNFESYRAPLQT
ncbi:MAG TPA: SDR family oxidoreductase [Dongiaceae bacterium]|nr:SDR family oxidoreductase [Dongiaceae bacterium]